MPASTVSRSMTLPAPSAPDRTPSPEITTRGRFFRRAATAGASLAAGGVVVGGLAAPAASAPSAEQDARTLGFLLELEDLQAAFYADAVKRGALKGDVLEFARVLSEHERDHVDYLRKALGAKARKPATFDFGEATAAQERFVATAVDLEETGLGAYTGAAVNLTPSALRDAAKILSVEARHTAWARDLAGRNPAPKASDDPASEGESRAAIARTAFVKRG